MTEFITIDSVGILHVDKVLVESNYPILFVCKNKNEDLFLCSCCQNNLEGKKWLITKTTPEIILKILRDEITLRESFCLYEDVQFTVFSDDSMMRVVDSKLDEWNFETSIFLPDKDEYMEVEEGEFEDEIIYYENMLKKTSFWSDIEVSNQISKVNFIYNLSIPIKIKYMGFDCKTDSCIKSNLNINEIIGSPKYYKYPVDNEGQFNNLLDCA